MFYWIVKGIFFPFVHFYLGLTRDGLENLPRGSQLTGCAVVTASCCAKRSRLLWPIRPK